MLDTAFPDANRLFSSPAKADGCEKWVDFVAVFPHCECICGLSEKAFTAKYQNWCKKHSYNFSESKALDIYTSACGHFSVIPKTNTIKLLVEQAVSQLQTTSSALAVLRNEMQSLAASLPEYPVVMRMFGVGPALGPQLMAENCNWKDNACRGVSKVPNAVSNENLIYDVVKTGYDQREDTGNCKFPE